ncbi:tyrosine-type recombinase/integrase [Candidatus Woesearchaeota archaeon]|nr:tyrosine-type recombinase/integrase [Candidatus Woesearchaeota archaeon]
MSNEKLLKSFKDELYIRGLSMKSINAFVTHNKEFLKWISKDARKTTQKDIKKYLKHLRKKGYAHATINLKLASIKSFYTKFLKRRFYDLKTLRKQDRYTGVVDKEIILKVINKTTNIKHKIILELLYSCGVRINEAVNVKLVDLNFYNKQLIVRQGKGSKQRAVKLSDKLISDYYLYIEKYKPKNYLFEGRKGHLTIRSGQEIVKKLFKKHAKLSVHPHMLRASFAAHSYENDVDPRKIQKFMGHADKRSTETYFRYAKIDLDNFKTPLDA